MFDKEDCFALIRSTEVYCSTNAKFNSAFHLIVQIFYKLGILTEENIIGWNDNAVDSLAKLGNENEV